MPLYKCNIWVKIQPLKLKYMSLCCVDYNCESLISKIFHQNINIIDWHFNKQMPKRKLQYPNLIYQAIFKTLYSCLKGIKMKLLYSRDK